MTEISLSRRSMLVGASAAGALGALGAGKWQPALARAPMLGTQAPYFYRFKLGSAEATIVSDGPLPLGDPHANFLGLSPEEMDKQLRDNFLPNDTAVLEQNALVLNTGDKLVLFDTGLGTLDLFGPTTGKLMNSLKQAGINPEDIDAVVMTHAHIDHCGGCMADDGFAAFPERRILHHRGRLQVLDRRDQGARAVQGVPRHRAQEPDAQSRSPAFLQGRRGDPAGHPGHLHAGAHGRAHGVHDRLRAASSFASSAIWRTTRCSCCEKPLTEFKYDTDPKQSAQSRVKMLGRLADERVALLAYHFAWPGIGHVARQGDGFRYFPQPMQMQL